MDITITKQQTQDQIAIQRDDGSTVNTAFAKKGWFPHDAVHWVVERQLDYHNGFWGRIAAGAAPEQIATIAKVAGHASTTRAQQPKPEIVELLQAERMVECLEAGIWGEPADFDTFHQVLAAACEQSQIPVPVINDRLLTQMRAELNRLSEHWRALPMGSALQLNWLSCTHSNHARQRAPGVYPTRGIS